MIALLMLALEAPRATGLDVASTQSVQALRECIVHRAGPTEDLVTDNGLMITIGSGRNMLGIHHTGPLTFAITDQGAERHITVLYRHPISAKAAAMNFRVYGRHCFPYELAASGLDKKAD